MILSDLIPGATYAIDYNGSKGGAPWKGLAIHRGVDVFPGYNPHSLCFSPLGEDGKPDGSEGVFDIEHVKALVPATKALILITSRYDYDGGEIFSSKVVMVPADFDSTADYLRFAKEMLGHPLYAKWVRKDGLPNERYASKVRKLWEDNLSLRFGETKSELDEWNV